MRLHRSSLLILAVVVTWVIPAAADDAADVSPALIQRCKKATALVDVGRHGSGTGFLVHASGLFVTNAHVVREVPPGSPVKLILSSGQPEQKIVSARVVLLDEENDLALLKTDAAVAAEPLTLSNDAGLVELARAIVFGYPFGTMLASGSEAYPAISINVGRISSLRHDGATLERIQLDAAVNPGNSGGPLVDKDGAVIGIVNSGIRGANVNFAIPAAKLLPILQKPLLSLKAPPIAFAKRTEAQKFEVEIFPTAPIPADAALTVRFGEAGAAARKPLTAVRTDGHWSVTASPADLGGTTTPLRLRLEAKFDELTLAANFDDGPVKIGERTLRLSELSKIEQKPDAARKSTTTTTTLAHYNEEREEYETLSGKVSGLPVVRSKINQVAVKLEDAKRIMIGTYDPGPLGAPYEIVLSSQGKTVASAEGTLVFTDPPRGLEFDEDGEERFMRSGMKIDPLITPEQDAKQGSWVRSEKGLETKPEASAWCELPVQPKDAWSLDLQVTPKQTGQGELLLWLPVGKTGALVRIDGKNGAAKLDLAEGKSRDAGESTPVAPFAEGKKFTVQAMARTAGERIQVVVWIDRGRPLFWFGPQKNLAPHKEIPVGAGRPAIGHHGLEMTVESVRVEAEGLRLLREMPGQIRHVFANTLGRWGFDTPPGSDRTLPSMFQGRSAALFGTPQIGVGPAVLGTGAMQLGGEAASGITVVETKSSKRGNHPNRTLSMWFRPEAAVPADQRQYLYDEGGDIKGFALYLEGTTLFAGGWDPNGAWPGTWLKAPGIVPDRWHHVALVLDGQSPEKAQAFHLYFDGVPMGAGFGQPIEPRETIAIGSVHLTTLASPESAANKAIKNHQFAGLIDEVEIFNAALGQGSISLLAGGRYGIGTPNDSAVSAPAGIKPPPASLTLGTPPPAAPAPAKPGGPNATPGLAQGTPAPGAGPAKGTVASGGLESSDLVVTGSGFITALLEDGAQAWSNRRYKWEAVPSGIKGWRYTKTAGGTAAEIKVRAKTSTTVRVITDIHEANVKALAGWTSSGEKFTSGGNKTDMRVFEKALSAGQELVIPQMNWAGTLVLVPNK